jgi:MATE family multidrug resistance protein
MLLMATVLIGAPGLLAGVYTSDAGVLRFAVLLLPIAGVFQVFDGLQVVAIGLLRGLGDTRVPMIANIVGFWAIGMPVSLWLAFGLGYGAEGLWWGLVVGLMIVAVFLVVRLRLRERHDLTRVLIDEHVKAVDVGAGQ